MRKRIKRSGVLIFYSLLIWGLYPAIAKSGFEPETGKIYSTRWTNGVPLGGIGCGKFEILTDGAFANFTINNNWDRRTGMVKGTFFAIHTDTGKKKIAKILRLRTDQALNIVGTVDNIHKKVLGLQDDQEYSNADNIKDTEYLGTFPSLKLKFLDEDLPVDIELSAFSPLIPNNITDSSLPVALLSFNITNKTDDNLDASLLFSWENILGYGGHREVHWENYDGNKQSESSSQNLSGILFTTDQKYSDQRQNTVGEYFIATDKTNKNDIKYCELWDAGKDEISWWAEFAQNGTISTQKFNEDKKISKPAGALIVQKKLKPKETQKIEFYVSWYMPNCITRYVKKIPTTETMSETRETTKTYDKNPDTRWTTQRPMLVGDSFIVDLGGSKKISRMVLDSHKNPTDFPRGYEIKSSIAGKDWNLVKSASKREAEIEQREGVITITFAPVESRYLKIVQQNSLPDYSWSIYELSIYELSDNKEQEITPISATAQLIQVKQEVIEEDISHYYTNFFKDAKSIAEYSYNKKSNLLNGTEEWQNLIKESNLPFWLKLKLINCAFPLFSNTILTRDGHFTVLESPVSMAGATGTMDQRMASHSIWTMLFPELDRRELEMFAKCQNLAEPISDGRIPHFTGNINEIIGNPNVTSGVRNWLDLSCSYVMQVLKFYRWTGDKKFINYHWQHIQRAMNFLKEADYDGDTIPEGGSTYDYEPTKPGAFCYTASCYLGALKSAKELARIMGDTEKEKEYQERFELVQKNVIKNLWNGKYFIKQNDPIRNFRNQNCFIAQLAGDWLTQLSGLGAIFPLDIRQSAINEILKRNVKPFSIVPSMEVTPDGNSVTNACYIIQDEPYIGMESIYGGFTDDGLALIRKVHNCVWIINKDPWCQALWVDTENGFRHGLVSYMTSPATWHILNALSGATLNLPEETLYISPRVPSYIEEWHFPIFFPKFWVWMDYVPDKKELVLKIIKVFGDEKISLSKIIGRKDESPILLKDKFIIKENSRLDLSEYFDQLLEK